MGTSLQRAYKVATPAVFLPRCAPTWLLHPQISFPTLNFPPNVSNWECASLETEDLEILHGGEAGRAAGGDLPLWKVSGSAEIKSGGEVCCGAKILLKKMPVGLLNISRPKKDY